MNFSQRITVILLALLFCVNLSAQEHFYIIKKNDTLTDVLYAKKLRPIYGKHGTLSKILKLNPHLRSHRGNKIFPDTKIVFAEGEMPVRMIAESGELAKSILASQIQTPGQEQKESFKPPASSVDDFKQTFYWNASPSISWKNLTSTDENFYRRSSIQALSDTSYGASFLYGMRFEENVDIYSSFFLESVNFAQDNSINLIKKKFISSRFGVGGAYKKNWLLEIAMNDEFFLTSPNSSTVEIKKVTLPEIRSSYIKSFYQYKEAELSYQMGGNLIFPRSSPEVDSHFSFGVGGALEAKLRNQSFRIGLDLNYLKAEGNSTNSQNIYWKYTWENL